MFTTYTGTNGGARISVVSGGRGSPEAELILFEFLEHTAATAHIRVSGSGGTHFDARPSDLVIARGVVRDEWMTQAYVTPSYPAAASYEVVLALAKAASNLGVRFHIGITRSSDSDLCGVGRPSIGGYLQPRHLEIVDYYSRVGVLNGDRESAAVVTLPTLFGRRGGAITSVADNIVTGETFTAGAGHTLVIEVALQVWWCSIDSMRQERRPARRLGCRHSVLAPHRMATPIHEGWRDQSDRRRAGVQLRRLGDEKPYASDGQYGERCAPRRHPVSLSGAYYPVTQR